MILFNLTFILIFFSTEQYVTLFIALRWTIMTQLFRSPVWHPIAKMQAMLTSLSSGEGTSRTVSWFNSHDFRWFATQVGSSQTIEQKRHEQLTRNSNTQNERNKLMYTHQHHITHAETDSTYIHSKPNQTITCALYTNTLRQYTINYTDVLHTTQDPRLNRFEQSHTQPVHSSLWFCIILHETRLADQQHYTCTH